MKTVCLIGLFLTSSFFPLQQNKPGVHIATLETRVFERVNAERVKRKLNPLKLDPKLSDIARAHSEDMAKRNYIAHVNPEGLTPSDRAHAAGYECHEVIGRYIYSGIAENIFQSNLYHRVVMTGAQIVYEWNTEDKIAMTSVNGWIESSGHRANILTVHYTRTGVGVAVSSDQKVYITQEFC